MAEQKKLVAEITAMDEDFTQWYTDVCIKAGLIAYSNIKGFMVYKPAGYAIWEAVQKHLDARFKAVGVENVYLPLLIPEHLLTKEKDLVEGFAPEVAWVTHGGSEELDERACVRPTSESLFSDFYRGEIQSYRDLPKVYNQWCSVVRWEKETRPFLRSREFMWQEGHTVHATAEEAEARTQQMLNVYADFCAEDLAIPTIKGRKTDKEKFAGAERTYTVECMMHDHKALQSGTSHYFGDGFARAFDITFQNKDNQATYPHQTSWGMSTRVIGGLIMTHGDDRGLVVPPRIAPIQVIVLPIAAHKPGVTEAAEEIVATVYDLLMIPFGVDTSAALLFFTTGDMGWDLLVYLLIRFLLTLSVYLIFGRRRLHSDDTRSMRQIALLSTAILILITLFATFTQEYRGESPPLFVISRGYALALALLILLIRSGIVSQGQARTELAVMERVMAEEPNQYEQNR